MSEQEIGTFAPAEELRPLIVIETEILWYKRQVGGGLLEIGRRLIEAKGQLDHGEWLGWLKDRVDFSEVKAQRLMRLARAYPNPSALTDLGVTKALALLALPESEREEFASGAHTVSGEEKTVSEMSTRELEQAIRERDKARQAAETARAERQAAETARAKMEADMVLAKNRLDDLDRQAREAEQQAELLRTELEELKTRPVEVAVQVDEGAVARARAEGEKAGAGAREKELAEVQKRLDAAEAERQAAESQAQALRNELEKAQTSSALKDDPDFVEFSVCFRGAQEFINRMDRSLARARSAGKTELTKRLENAALALSEAMRKIVGGC